jgi:hypothetical protein
MKSALALLVLMSFASPVPCAEFGVAHDDDAILEATRANRPCRARETTRLREFELHPPLNSAPPGLPESRPIRPGNWTPRLFSRPPPR